MDAQNMIGRFIQAQRVAGTAAALAVLDVGLLELGRLNDQRGLIQLSRMASAAAEQSGDPALAARYLKQAPEPASPVWQHAMFRLLASCRQIEEGQCHFAAGLALAEESGDPAIIELFRESGA